MYQPYRDYVKTKYLALMTSYDENEFEAFLTVFLSEIGVNEWLEGLRGTALEPSNVTDLINTLLMKMKTSRNQLPMIIEGVTREYALELPIGELIDFMPSPVDETLDRELSLG